MKITASYGQSGMRCKISWSGERKKGLMPARYENNVTVLQRSKGAPQ
jgi:hypothetical protein